MTLILYLMRKFIPIFIGTLAFFCFVMLLVDILMNLWQYILEGVSALDVIKVAVLYIPKSLSFSAPLAILFSTAFTLSSFYANNELTVIFASGISLFRFTLPLLIFSIVASVGLFFFEDNVVVPNFKKKVETQQLALNESTSYDNNRIVVLADGGSTVYRADYYNDTQQRLSNLYIFTRHEDKTLDQIIHTDSASWDGEKWLFSQPVTYTHTGNELLYSTGTDYITTEIPDTFRNIAISVEEVNIKQAREYIEKLRRTGLPFAEESSQYHEKFSYPFIIFISVFLSIGLSGKSQKNVLLISLASCVSAAVLFYIGQMITMLLAKFSYISPLAGAWIPVILFTCISIALVRFART